MGIHGTPTEDNAVDICRNGLISEYPELNYTADLIRQDDKFLYDKLKSWPHWNFKYLVLCVVSKQSGKGGIPIWQEKEDGFYLPPQFIKGYIDVKNRELKNNRLYDEKFKCIGVEDQSYRPISGEAIGVRLPLDEDFCEEIFDSER